MCGIVGIIDFNKNRVDEEIFSSMIDSLYHRGPDDKGMVWFDTEAGKVWLGHRRLSIIDLSELGHQPMQFENLSIVYNGEVYNFREVRKELEKEGYKFNSHSDTEVILKAYHRWGIKCVDKFRGMWVFAIFDKSTQTLTICRDRLGIKPIYWYFKNGLFLFASELKAFFKFPYFSKEINGTALSMYLQFGYIPAPFSIFENTFKLEPASFLTLSKSQNISFEKYWDIKSITSKKTLSANEETLTRELEETLTESFKYRLVADVPVGVFLSGGIDSSLVCAILQSQMSDKLKTFTIGFYENKYNEAHWAKKVAEYIGTEHTEFYCTAKDAFEVIPKLPEIYDEPFGDSSGIPTYLVSKLAREYVKVALSADGGDEQFLGYVRYQMIGDKLRTINKFPIRIALKNILPLLSAKTAERLYSKLKFILPEVTNFRDKFIKLKESLKYADPYEQYEFANRVFSDDELRLLGIKPNAKRLSELKGVSHKSYDIMRFMSLLDICTYLPDDILTKVDRATMSVSLEGREPLLDHKIVEFSAKLPNELKYKDGESKYILKRILRRYLPNELIDRPKQGFGVPIYEWFRKELTDLYREYLSYNRMKSIGMFNADFVKDLLTNYINGEDVGYVKLWVLFIFELWREKWKIG